DHSRDRFVPVARTPFAGRRGYRWRSSGHRKGGGPGGAAFHRPMVRRPRGRSTSSGKRSGGGGTNEDRQDGTSEPAETLAVYQGQPRTAAIRVCLLSTTNAAR